MLTKNIMEMKGNIMNRKTIVFLVGAVVFVFVGITVYAASYTGQTLTNDTSITNTEVANTKVYSPDERDECCPAECCADCCTDKCCEACCPKEVEGCCPAEAKPCCAGEATPGCCPMSSSSATAGTVCCPKTSTTTE